MYLTFAVQYNYTLDLNLLLKTLNATVAKQAKLIKSLMAQIGALSQMIIALNKHLLALQSENAELKNKKNSNNSHIPP